MLLKGQERREGKAYTSCGAAAEGMPPAASSALGSSRLQVRMEGRRWEEENYVYVYTICTAKNTCVNSGTRTKRDVYAAVWSPFK